MKVSAPCLATQQPNTILRACNPSLRKTVNTLTMHTYTQLLCAILLFSTWVTITVCAVYHINALGQQWSIQLLKGKSTANGRREKYVALYSRTSMLCFLSFPCMFSIGCQWQNIYRQLEIHYKDGIQRLPKTLLK